MIRILEHIVLVIFLGFAGFHICACHFGFEKKQQAVVQKESQHLLRRRSLLWQARPGEAPLALAVVRA